MKRCEHCGANLNISFVGEYPSCEHCGANLNISFVGEYPSCEYCKQPLKLIPRQDYLRQDLRQDCMRVQLDSGGCSNVRSENE
jgi:hypothetical protein